MFLLFKSGNYFKITSAYYRCSYIKRNNSILREMRETEWNCEEEGVERVKKKTNQELRIIKTCIQHFTYKIKNNST